MTITYPLTAPTRPRPSGLVFRASSVVGMSRSPFTNEQEVQAHQGDYWECDVQLPPMQREFADIYMSVLIALNGREGTLVFGMKTSPRGVATGAPLVMGGSQTGKTLATDGWTAGVPGILLAGDWLQLGSGGNVHLHRVVQDVNSNGSGQATLDIWPRLRTSPADNSALVLVDPVGLWRLSENKTSWNVSYMEMQGLNFSLIEAM